MTKKNGLSRGGFLKAGALGISALAMARTAGGLLVPKTARAAINSEILIEGFESANDWAVVRGSCVVANDTVHYSQGSQSVKLTPNTGAAGIAQKTISIILADYIDCMQLDVYIADMYAKVGSYDDPEMASISISLTSTTNFSRYMVWSRTVAELGPGWNRILIRPDEWTNIGGDSWSNTMIRMRIQVTSRPSYQPKVSFDNFRGGIVGADGAAVMFTFDDSDPTTYTKAYKDVMEVMGYRGTKYVTSANVGIGGMITAAQCLEMQADGWCIGDHGHSHHNLNDLNYFPDAQAIIDEITTSFDELDALGLGQDKTIFAYPVSPPHYTWIEEAVETAGVVSAMGVANVYYQSDPALAHANIGRGPLSGMENLNFAKAIVDEAVAHNCLAVFAFHKIVDLSISNPPPANEWLKSDLQRLCDYIAAYGTISVITHKDLV